MCWTSWEIPRGPRSVVFPETISVSCQTGNEITLLLALQTGAAPE
jgi:hypothetical protein